MTHLQIDQEDLQECFKQLKMDTDEEQEEEQSWTITPLRGMYYRQREEVADIKKSYQWMEKNGLKDCTEALIMGAQEQAQSTSWQSPICSLCPRDYSTYSNRV